MREKGSTRKYLLHCNLQPIFGVLEVYFACLSWRAKNNYPWKPNLPLFKSCCLLIVSIWWSSQDDIVTLHHSLPFGGAWHVSVFMSAWNGSSGSLWWPKSRCFVIYGTWFWFSNLANWPYLIAMSPFCLAIPSIYWFVPLSIDGHSIKHPSNSPL